MQKDSSKIKKPLWMFGDEVSVADYTSEIRQAEKDERPIIFYATSIPDACRALGIEQHGSMDNPLAGSIVIWPSEMGGNAEVEFMGWNGCRGPGVRGLDYLPDASGGNPKTRYHARRRGKLNHFHDSRHLRWAICMRDEGPSRFPCNGAIPGLVLRPIAKATKSPGEILTGSSYSRPRLRRSRRPRLPGLLRDWHAYCLLARYQCSALAAAKGNERPPPAGAR